MLESMNRGDVTVDSRNSNNRFVGNAKDAWYEPDYQTEIRCLSEAAPASFNLMGVLSTILPDCPNILRWLYACPCPSGAVAHFPA